MIRSFRSPEAEALFNDRPSRRFQTIQQVVRRKREMLAAAHTLEDLTSPPGNRLEALKGDRLGQHSIRIHAPWRLRFRRESGEAHEVEIVDYH